jgi:hypothetical protein
MRFVRLRYIVVMMLTAFVMTAFQAPALAQKKKKGASSTTAVSAKHVQVKKGTATIRDILSKLRGQQTNIGVLKEISGDYVTFESDGDTLIFPLRALQQVKLGKAEEGETRQIEIRFVAGD